MALFGLCCLNTLYLINILKVEATCTAETLVSFYRMLRCVDWWSVTDAAGQQIGPICKSQVVHSSSLKGWPLKIGPVGISETSVPYYQLTLRNIAEERRPRLHHIGKPEGEKV